MSSAIVPEPPPPLPPGPPARLSFDFVRPLAFVFEDPRWVPKVLLGGLFILASIFIIGAFFVYGYMARLVRNVIEGQQHPLPEWDDLGDFFAEGFKLFVVGLVYTIPIALLIAILIIPVAIMSNVGDNDAVRTFGGMSVSCVWCLIFPLGLALALWLPAALLMVITSGQFSAAFDFTHIARFIRANIGNYILAFVVWLVARFAAGLGILLLCIGVIFTFFWAFAVAAYAFGQVYRLAQER
jgi:uncharacterized protein DUF4013